MALPASSAIITVESTTGLNVKVEFQSSDTLLDIECDLRFDRPGETMVLPEMERS